MLTDPAGAGRAPPRPACPVLRAPRPARRARRGRRDRLRRPDRAAARPRRHRHHRQDHHRATCSRPGLRAAGRSTGLIGTVETRIGGADACRARSPPRGARPAGAVRGDGRARRHRRGDGGVQPRAGARPGRRHRVRRRRVHQPRRRTTWTSTPTWRTTSRPRRCCSTAGRAAHAVDLRRRRVGRRLAGAHPRRGHRRRPTAPAPTGAPRDVDGRADGSQHVHRSHGPDGAASPARLRLPGRVQRGQRAARARLPATPSGVPPQAGRRGRRRGRGARAGWSGSTPASRSSRSSTTRTSRTRSPPCSTRCARRSTGRLIVVLGCRRRPGPGQAAADGRRPRPRRADVLVVTDDNPRSEDPAAIRAAVLAGRRAARPRPRRGAARSATGARRSRRRSAAAAAGRHGASSPARATRQGQEVARRRAPVRRPRRAAARARIAATGVGGRSADDRAVQPGRRRSPHDRDRAGRRRTP